MIDKQYVVDVLRGDKTYPKGTSLETVDADFKEVADWIDRNVGQWIPTCKQKPVLGELVLCYWGNFSYTASYLYHVSNGKEEWRTPVGTNGNMELTSTSEPMYWMPLPSSPYVF